MIDLSLLAAGTAHLGLGALAVVIIAGRPQRAVLLWLSVLVLVPYWWAPTTTVFVPAITVVTIAALAALWRSPAPTRDVRDLLVVALGASVALLAVLGVAERSAALVVIAQWVLTYFVGRRFGRLDVVWVSRAFGATGVLLGALAVLEFALDWHPFTQFALGNRASLIWSVIQYRGGAARSEWTAGHSIALGNLIAMTLPFLFTARLSGAWTALGTVFCVAGIAVTFSRGALVAGAMALLASLVLLGRTRDVGYKVPTVLLTALTALAAVPVLAGVYGNAASELSSSTLVRFRMLELLPSLRPFGAAGNAVPTVDGRIGFQSSRGVFRTLDNTFLHFALQFGWVPTLALLAFAASLVWIVLRRTSSPAGVAMGAQVCVMFTVAMITQFATLFWLLAGMAITQSAASAGSAARGSDDESPGVPQVPPQRSTATSRRRRQPPQAQSWPSSAASASSRVPA